MSVTIPLVPFLLRVSFRSGYRARWRVGPWFACIYLGGGRRRRRRA